MLNLVQFTLILLNSISPITLSILMGAYIGFGLILSLYGMGKLKLTKFRDRVDAFLYTKRVMDNFLKSLPEKCYSNYTYREIHNPVEYRIMTLGINDPMEQNWCFYVFKNLSLDQRLKVNGLRSALVSKGINFKTYYNDKDNYVWALGPEFSYQPDKLPVNVLIGDQIAEELMFCEKYGLEEDTWYNIF